MILSLIILYVLTLIYLSIADRFRNHTSILAIQGLLIFGIAMARLHEFHTVEMIFIIVETLLFKAIVIPAILMRVIHKTKINRIHSSASQFGALVMSIAALIASCTITYYMADNRTDMIFFGVALYALLTGLILIVMRKRIFAHLVGFLVIENGVFLFSMAIGVELPILINLAIMLDILISILILGMFLRRMDNDIHTDETDALTSIECACTGNDNQMLIYITLSLLLAIVPLFARSKRGANIAATLFMLVQIASIALVICFKQIGIIYQINSPYSLII